jgi:hypothetical protein
MDKDASDEKSGDDGSDLEGHHLDYIFSPSQVEWIKKCFGNSENFMLCYGLKPYDPDDREEATAIADAIPTQ